MSENLNYILNNYLTIIILVVLILTIKIFNDVESILFRSMIEGNMSIYPIIICIVINIIIASVICFSWASVMDAVGLRFT